jgi:fibrillarin-like pre-rRNA processing protein
MPVKSDQLVLYLGAASGTTPSHISDIVGIKGHVYCVEFAPRSIRDLVNNVCVHRLNMTPFVEDARFPEKYAVFIPGKVDVVYCDVAQPEQAKILADNADMLLKKAGWILLAVKAPSIDVTKDPKSIYKHEAKILKKRGFKIKEIINLEPFDKAHAMILGQK